ncbi:MAG TPA: pitrilysin family protein [Candidatus Eisenbacteria bacterium]|nr:pitrilysin family protein [Candidatus Eisenbacteria bacterium]
MNAALCRRPSGRPRRLSATLVLGLAVALVALASFAAPALAGVKPPPVKLDLEKYALPNGLEVILIEDHRLPIVAVNTWYHVGPANETVGRTGFAHLFEHMMFQSSGHVGEDEFWKYLEGAGSSFINGTTDFDRTNYMEDVPANQLELALWLESDRMGFLQDRLDAASLANQQDVVRNERRQSVENAPYQLVEEEMFHLLYPKGHPYYAWVIGSHEDIQAAKIDDVKDFFKRYYCPNNASLVIVGDIDKAKTKALVEKYYGTIPRGEPVPPITATTPPITAEKRAVVTDKVELARVYMAWITSPIYKPGDADAAVSANILGGGKASRLYKSLVYEKQIAQDVNVQQLPMTLGSVFQVTATVKPGHTPEEVEKAIDAEMARFAAEGPTEAEVDAAQNSIYSGIVTSLENFGGFAGVADRINQYNHHLKNPNYLEEDLARFAAVTPASAKEFAASQLKTEARVVVHGIPGDKKLPAEPPTPPKMEASKSKVESAEPWRNAVPAAGPTAQAALPTPKRFALPNGLQVYVVEAHHLPIVSANLVLRSGSAADPKNAPGLAGFTAAMLDEGTAKRDALGIANEIYALGGTLATGSTVDGSNASVRALKQNMGSALSILSDVVLNPAFPAKEVDRIRNDRLTTFIQQRDQTFQTAIRVMNACLFGPAHPYGHTVLGTEESLKKVSRDDLVKFYKSSYGPKNAALILVGDLSEAEARKLATDAFGTWKGSGAAPALPSSGAMAASRVVIVDKPGSPQTAVLAGQFGVKRSDPDYEKLDVMNTVMGGLFSSRINLNLREDKGYSYGAFSFIAQSRGVGALMAGASVRSDVTGPSVDEVLKEVKKMKEAGVTADELRMAKDSITRSLPANFETTFSTAGTMASIYLFDLPLDYYQTLPTRIDAITAADVSAVAKKHLVPERMMIVAVGDKKLIEPQIAKLSLGVVAERDADGKEVVAKAN